MYPQKLTFLQAAAVLDSLKYRLKSLEEIDLYSSGLIKDFIISVLRNTSSLEGIKVFKEVSFDLMEKLPAYVR